jgi:hypothetical protein
VELLGFPEAAAELLGSGLFSSVDALCRRVR